MSLTLQAVAPDRRTDMALTDERVSLDWLQLDDLLNRAANALNDLDLHERRVAVMGGGEKKRLVDGREAGDRGRRGGGSGAAGGAGVGGRNHGQIPFR